MKILSYTLLVNSILFSMSSAIKADDMNVLHKYGQTFITWKEDIDQAIKYNLYMSDSPINEENFKSARLVANNIPSGTGIDMLAEQSKSLPIIYAVKDEYSSDWYYDIYVADPANKDKPKHGLSITTFGKYLPAGTGLYVRNVKESGTAYYAIAKIDQAGKITGSLLSSTEPTLEKSGNPEPVLEKLKKFESGETVRYYTHWSTTDISLKENTPFKFELQTGIDVGKDDKPSPLVLLLHGAGGAETLPVPVESNFIVLVPNNYTPGFPFVYDWWYGYNTECYNGNLKNGINVNYTEKRLLYLIDWVKSTYNIDENRIYLTGGSMGGTGTLNFGLRHPEIFAAIYANVPHTNMGDGVGPSESWFESMWGKRIDGIKTNDGMNIWDRLNMTKYVSDPKNDIPFVKTLNSREDLAMPWQQIPPFIKALDNTRRGFISGWGVGMHNLAFDCRPIISRKFDPFKIKKNQSYLAFSNTTINDDPGNGDPKNGIITGQMGGGFVWDILTDDKSKWSAKISHIADTTNDVLADITPRRLQYFKIAKDKKYFFSNTDSNGKILQSGYILPDDLMLITLKQIMITSSGNILTISRKR